MPGHAPGVLVKRGDVLHFVPAEVAVAVVRRPPVSRVPGSPLGVSLIGGRVLPVLELGAERGELLVCEVRGTELAIDGLRVVDSGFFETEQDGVVLDGLRVPELDLSSELESVEREIWTRGKQAR